MSETVGQVARPRAPAEVPDDPRALADTLHAATWMLLRRLRPLELLEGVSGPAIWALTHIVEAPGVTTSAIAASERVSLPTASRAVKELEAAGLVDRRPDPDDRRTQRLYPTPEGLRRLKDGRRRRVARLAQALQALEAKDRRALARAAELLRALGEE